MWPHLAGDAFSGKALFIGTAPTPLLCFEQQLGLLYPFRQMEMHCQ